MKTDKEFLKGVYEKAEMLESEKNEKNPFLGMFLRYSSVAALFVMIPLIYVMSRSDPATPLENPMEVPSPRIVSMDDIGGTLEDAEIIVTGVVDNNILDDGQDLGLRLDSVVRGQVSGDYIGVWSGWENDLVLADGEEVMLLLVQTDGGYSLVDEVEGILYKDASGLYVDAYGHTHAEENLRKE